MLLDTNKKPKPVLSLKDRYERHGGAVWYLFWQEDIAIEDLNRVVDSSPTDTSFLRHWILTAQRNASVSVAVFGVHSVSV